uniref:Uncharacterized protein n=1 Tax=Micrurus lemniscatus lemniscatus TaxID=129467 RepID=A0A2D4HJ76_MICLE
MSWIHVTGHIQNYTAQTAIYPTVLHILLKWLRNGQKAEVNFRGHLSLCNNICSRVKPVTVASQLCGAHPTSFSVCFVPLHICPNGVDFVAHPFFSQSDESRKTFGHC